MAYFARRFACRFARSQFKTDSDAISILPVIVSGTTKSWLESDNQNLNTEKIPQGFMAKFDKGDKANLGGEPEIKQLVSKEGDTHVFGITIVRDVSAGNDPTAGTEKVRADG